MKTSYKRIDRFKTVANAYLKEHPQLTRFTHALKRVMSRTRPLDEMMADKMVDTEIEHVVTETRKDGEKDIKVITKDEKGNYEFSPEGFKLCTTAKRKLWIQNDLCEIEPHFSSSIPEDLEDEQLDAFEGFVIQPEKVKYIRQLQEAKFDEEEKKVAPPIPETKPNGKDEAPFVV